MAEVDTPSTEVGEFYNGLPIRNAGATVGIDYGSMLPTTTLRMLDPARIYNSYAGTDIVAEIVLPNEKLTLGELQTISYSIHRENVPVRILGRVTPVGFVKGPRTIAGSMIFTVFNYYAFYRINQFKNAVNSGLYPLSDMLPPFDIVLTFANEVGSISKMKIYGVTIVDEGQTMSVDDLIVEQTYQFMARGIQPLLGFAMDPAATTSGTNIRKAVNAMAFNR